MPHSRRTRSIAVATGAAALLSLSCSATTADPQAPPAGTIGARPGTAPATNPVAVEPPPTPSSTAVVAPTTTSPPPPSRSAVGTIRHTIVDPARGRKLDTLVHYPAETDGTGTEALAGPFPLVLMAHGYRLPADGYERMLLALTRRGYVVAAPDFPHTSGNGGDGNRADIVNQPADLAAVIDAVVGGTVPAVPAIDHPDRVAVMGHSDGGLTASAMAYNTQYRDPRIVAAVVMTGGRALFPGSYFAPGAPPLLAVHGTADETNAIGASERLFRDLPAGVPGYFVRVDGGSHLGPYMFDSGMPALGDVIADFLDAHLGPTVDPGAIALLLEDGARPPFSIEAR